MMTKSLSILAFFCLLVAVSVVDNAATFGGTGVNAGVSDPNCTEWTAILNRFNGSMNFSRNWIEYKNGFGDTANGEFWVGNEIVHLLTSRSAYTLRIELQADATGEWYYAEYSSFSIESESNEYTLHVSGYSGNAGDAFTNTSLEDSVYLDGMKFSTWDDENDQSWYTNCAEYNVGGWWFNACHNSCLTCHYVNAFHWGAYYGWPTGDHLRAARMMIKSK